MIVSSIYLETRMILQPIHCIVMVLILLNLAKHLKVNSGINVEKMPVMVAFYFKLFAFRKIALSNKL